MALHKDLTGADLHEPKGQAAAAVNTVYVADGAGSGTHKKVPLLSLDLTTMESPNTYYLSGVLPDVSTSSLLLIPVIDQSTLISIRCTLNSNITVADSTLTFLRQDGASLGTPLVIPFTGSALGVGYSFAATTNTTIAASGWIKIETDGLSTTAAALSITLKLTRIP